MSDSTVVLSISRFGSMYTLFDPPFPFFLFFNASGQLLLLLLFLFLSLFSRDTISVDESAYGYNIGAKWSSFGDGSGTKERNQEWENKWWENKRIL